ncbi:hypothetical protein OPQ81_008819 [Rhizoctonia solani]|nr:hypothetical protein OPQ81_008819 [Rhizoctonia solani]
MDTCSSDTDIISELLCLQSRFLEALNSGISAYKAIGDQLKATFERARQCLVQSPSPTALAQAMVVVARTCLTYTQLEEDSISMEETLTTSISDVFSRAGLRRRRKRTNRSHKSKGGKNGHVRKSGKKSKRGRKSPVGNPKRRVQTESSKSGSKHKSQDSNGKKCRNVTAPPTDSMKFGPCRDFFLAHLGDPYPTTVQKHQILKQSSPDFTLRSLNLWFVNIRRRSKWMDIFKKHAGSKRDAMRDLVARVEAQVAGRPPPNPLPSGAAPPGCKVDQTIVEEVMAMRAVVDMVSREVYGEGWDQILQIKPWTDEEVRAHEERKKAARRQARESKVDGEKRKREREEQKILRQRERDQRKRIEQDAVEGIRAARELHAKLMAMNKRKREDEDESEESSKRRQSRDTYIGDTIEPKKRKVKVPKFDDMGNPLTKDQRKAIKRAMLAEMQANPLKRKSPEAHNSGHASNDGPVDTSPSKRRRRDAATFEGFPAAGATTEAESMTDLTQLFSLEWASPQAQPAQLPPVSQNPSPTAPQAGYGGFSLPSGSQPAPVPSNETPGPEVPRRFSQQLAAFALESGMFDNQNFELFTTDTFPGMEVDVHSGNGLTSGAQDAPNNNAFGTGMHNAVDDFGVNRQPPPLHLNTNASATGSMSVSPIQSQLQTPMQQFATPTQHHVPPFDFAPPNDHSHSIHESTNFGPSNDSSQHSNADSNDMSWINAALEQLPSQHDVGRMNGPQFPSQGGEFGSQVHYPSQYNAQHASEYDQRPSTAVSEWHEPAQRMPQPQQHTQNSQPRPSYPSSATSTPMPPPQARPLFSQPQNKPSPQPQARPSVSQPPQRHRAPGSLWQTPHSQPQPQPRYTTPGPSTYTQPPVLFPAPHPPHSYPPPATPQYSQPQPYTPVQYDERPQERRGDVAPDNTPYGSRYQPEQPMYQEQSQTPPTPQIAAKNLLKDREAEFARAQEVLQAQFRKEQEEQLARFMRAQEELRNQILGSSSGPRAS